MIREPIVVKVQLSRFSSAGRKMMLVTSSDERVIFEQLAAPDVLAALAGRDRAFFHAELVDGLVVLGRPALASDW